MRKVMSWEEHDRYLHLCGKTGLELRQGVDFCSPCWVIRECLLDHCMPELAELTDEDYERAVDETLQVLRRPPRTTERG